MKKMFLLTVLVFALSGLKAQAYLGQRVPDITETDCNGNSERIYDLLSAGKPILVFKTDMICSNTTAWGTTVRQFADLYASEYRTWVCADFQEASTPADQCFYMQQYEQQTGMNTASVFRFIDTSSAGPYDPGSRGLAGIQCYQGYIVVGLDSTIIHLGNDLTEAVNAAVNASTTTSISTPAAEMGVQLYPNPVASLMKIQTEKDIKSMQVFELSGRLVFYSEQPSDHSALDVSSFRKGAYLIRLTTGDGSTIKRNFVVD
jgi:hypothetical protein